MPLGAAVAAPPRPVSPARSAFHPQNSSPLNPLTRPSSKKPLTRPCASHPSLKAATTTSSTQTHLYNLERLLQKQALPPPHDTHDPGGNAGSASGNGLLNALNLSGLFPFSRAAAEEMSPRSLNHLQRVLADSPRPSPRNTIAPRWRQYHGAGDWAGLLDPLDENLRRELVRYGDLVQATYHAFHSNPDIRPDRSRLVALPDRSYRVTRSLYATASVELPRWVSGVAPWMAQRSSWIGYVAVCDNEREIQRMGRRDIVIALRGTATCLEWAENLRAGLVPMDDGGDYGEEEVTKPRHLPKVECGFWNLYKTAGAQLPSLSTAVVQEVRRLIDRYKGEELSITVTGHSLGAALAVLVADELSTCAASVPPVAVFSFGGPRVGNRAFVDRVEGRGVKVLRVVNAHDVVTRVPGVLPAGDGKDGGWPARVLEALDGYADVGRELRVDSRVSPYLRPNADPACCHDLEAYLHLVDGFLGTHCPFRSNAKRSLARLLSQQGSNVKKLYMSKARAIAVDHNSAADAALSTTPTYLASPSS